MITRPLNVDIPDCPQVQATSFLHGLCVPGAGCTRDSQGARHLADRAIRHPAGLVRAKHGGVLAPPPPDAFL